MLLVQDGWEAVTHLRVAERSGLGRATIYRHWPQASDLVRDVLAQEALKAAVPTTNDLRRDLVDLLKLVRRELVNGGFGRVLAALIDRAEWDSEVYRIKIDVVQEGTSVIMDRIVLAVERGEIGPVDVRQAVSQLAGPILYSRLLSGERITTSFITSIVNEFVETHSCI
jgi:AcrR family transcriptional regulator